MDNNGLANDKLCVISTNPEKTQEDNEPSNQTLESEFIVTECLSSCEDCNGRYEDNTGQFKIQCRCNCHNSPGLLLGENKKSACLGSSQDKQKRIVYNDIIVGIT